MINLTYFIIFLSLIGIAIGNYPNLRMNRSTIAMVAAVFLVFTGGITLEQAYLAINMDTILLLLAMMIINVNLSIAGFFQIVASKVNKVAKSPKILLALVIISSGILSALFLNDTICVMFTPLILEITLKLKRNPIPYLMGLATAANVGSTATIIGNPQNMLIGIAGKISFVKFLLYQLPVALIGLFFIWLIILLVYKSEFNGKTFDQTVEFNAKIYRPLLIKSTITTIGMIVLFFSGVSVTLASLMGASALLITRRLKPQRVFQEIDWSLLVFFSGLFVITGAIETTGLGKFFFSVLKPISGESTINLSFVSVLLSNLISNVPAVLLYLPVIKTFANPEKGYLVLAMATTLAGNVTLLGSVANLIVAETAKKRGINLSFVEYLKAGLPIAIITLAIGIIWFGVII
jgi:Na+/H+ antiporter NhaD/arsenite permease-like protein